MAKIELEIGANVQDLLAGFEQMKKQMAEFDAKMKGTFEKMSKEGEDAAQSLSKAMTESMIKSATTIEKTAGSLDGLYDELKALETLAGQSTMPEAQKELQKQIDATKKKIQDLGGATRQFKDLTNMSLGEMRKYMRELRNISLVGMSPKQIAEVNGKIAELTDAMGDYRAMLAATGDKTAMVIESFQGFVAIAQGVTGTLSLFGIENQKLEKSMMALINLSMAMQTIHQMNESKILPGVISQVKNLWKTFLANPYAVVIAGAVAVGGAIMGVVTWLNREKKARIELSAEEKNAIANNTSEFLQLRQLQAVIQGNTASYQDKQAAIAKMKEIMPGYNAQLSAEGVLLSQNTQAIREYVAMLYNKIKLQVAEEKATELIKSQIEAAEKLKKLYPDLASGAAQVTDIFGNQIKIMIDEASGKIIQFNDAVGGWTPVIAMFDGELGDLTATYDELGKQINTLLNIPITPAINANTTATNTNTKAVKENTATYEKSAKVLSQESLAINALKKAWEEIDPATRNVMSQFAEIRDDGLLRAVLADDTEALYKYYENGKITWDKYMELLDIVQNHKKAMAENDVDWMRIMTDVGKRAANELYNTYKESLDNQISATEDYIGRRTQLIGELESLLAAEVQLNEQGYASNIQLYQQRIEKEQQLRDEAMAQKEKYEKRKQAIETVSQAIDMSSAIAAMLKDAGVKFGVLAPIIGGAMIAALLMLFKKSKTQAAQTARFAKGGKGILHGASHSAGGVNLGEIGEGEGGEAYYILNKKATAKNRSLMDAVFDAVNGNRINLPLDAIASGGGTMTVELKEQAEIKEILKHMKSQKATVYGNGFRDETFGNVRRRIWTN